MRVYVICVYVCLLGDICNIDGFYFRAMECSKNILFTLLLLIHGHTHECSLYIHSLQKNPVIPAVCPSNGVFQCANSVSSFFFLRSRKRLRCTLGSVRGCRAASSPLCLLPQRPPRSHEREEHAAAWGAGSGMQSSSRGQGQPAEQLKLCPGGEAESRAGGQGEKVAGRGTAVAGLLLWRKSCRRGA
ncbi:unnamed protein product [Rangifer tarandus platyrhynchus]|uniref:Uncharacterized protein n=1 Tax=Rangifer tarandus platyrhynchus TaxID=3082113 RepID=A0AC59YE83_RANTA